MNRESLNYSTILLYDSACTKQRLLLQGVLADENIVTRVRIFPAQELRDTCTLWFL